MALPSKTERPPLSWSMMTGMRPLGLCAVNQGSFWMFLPMSMAWETYCRPYASLSSSSTMLAL